MPKEPTPENKSRTVALFKLISNFFECERILKIDSLVKSLSGRVFISLG